MIKAYDDYLSRLKFCPSDEGDNWFIDFSPELNVAAQLILLISSLSREITTFHPDTTSQSIS